MTELVDTNVWVRYFARDNEEQYQQVVNWFQDAQKGKRKLLVHPIVVAEVCYVLESLYPLDRVRIAQVWKVALAQKWLKVIEQPVLDKVWDWYESSIHFVDAYLLAYKHVYGTKIVSFDVKLNALARRQSG